LLLKTRKVFQQTKILVVTNRDLPPVPVREFFLQFVLGHPHVRFRELIEQDVAAVKEVTVDDVNALIGRLNPRDFTQLSIGPAPSD